MSSIALAQHGYGPHVCFRRAQDRWHLPLGVPASKAKPVSECALLPLLPMPHEAWRKEHATYRLIQKQVACQLWHCNYINALQVFRPHDVNCFDGLTSTICRYGVNCLHALASTTLTGEVWS